jgi:hypothetical protein
MNKQTDLKQDAVEFLIEEGLIPEGYERLVFMKGDKEIVLNDLLVEFAMRSQLINYCKN